MGLLLGLVELLSGLPFCGGDGGDKLWSTGACSGGRSGGNAGACFSWGPAGVVMVTCGSVGVPARVGLGGPSSESCGAGVGST